MANLIKTVLTFDDSSTQEFDAAPASAKPTISNVVVNESDGSSETLVPQQS